jgi:hypothetical protein
MLVIDASVAHAAGTVSMHPTSRNCREFLQTVLNVCHHVVMTAAIKSEWNKHQSAFARTWRKAMMARKKIEVVEIPPSSSLAVRITRAVRNARLAEIIAKDRPLIEAALATENRVVSLDDQVRGHLQAHHDTLPEVTDICWVNPGNPAEDPVDWLTAGAPADALRKLGHSHSKPDP